MANEKDPRRDQNAQQGSTNDQPIAQNTSAQEYDQLLQQTDEERTKKPGSQSSSSDQHNNGRGGGK